MDKPRSAQDALEEHLKQKRAAERAPGGLSAAEKLDRYIDDPEFRRAAQQAPSTTYQNQSDDGPSFRETPWERQQREELDRLKDIKLSSEGIANEPVQPVLTTKEKVDFQRYIDDADYRRALQRQEKGLPREPEPARPKPSIRGRSPPSLER